MAFVLGNRQCCVGGGRIRGNLASTACSLDKHRAAAKTNSATVANGALPSQVMLIS